MAHVGRKIYYGKSNGLIIWDKGEMSGVVQQTTFEQDCQKMSILSIVSSEELGVLQLEHGQYKTEFATCYKYTISPEGVITFDYSLPPESPKINETDECLALLAKEILILKGVI